MSKLIAQKQIIRDRFEKAMPGQNHIGGYKDYYASRIAAAILCEAGEGAAVPWSPVLFTGHAGLGKTSACKIVAQILSELGYTLVELPPKVTRAQLINILVNQVQGKRVVIFGDEAHEIVKGPGISVMLRQILETQGQIAQVRLSEDIFFESNPFDHIWIFATNEEAKDAALFGPTGRCHHISFTPYKAEEMGEVVDRMLARKNLKASDEAKRYLIDRVLPNPRAVARLADDLIDYPNAKREITIQGAKQMASERFRFRLGLCHKDLRIMTYLAGQSAGMQVQELAARLDNENPRNVAHIITTLMSLGFVITGSNGRKRLTEAGAAYLQGIVEDNNKIKKNKERAEKEKEAKAKVANLPSDPEPEETPEEPESEEAKAKEGKEVLPVRGKGNVGKAVLDRGE